MEDPYTGAEWVEVRTYKQAAVKRLSIWHLFRVMSVSIQQITGLLRVGR